MAITNTRLDSTSAITVFTAVGQQAITTLYLCNTTGNAATVDVNCIDTGAGPVNVANTTIYSQLEITGNDTYVISTEKLILDDTDVIECTANISDAITVTVSSIAV